MTVLGFSEEEIILCSAKTGVGVEDILKAVVDRIPAAAINPTSPLTNSLYFSSFGVFTPNSTISCVAPVAIAFIVSPVLILPSWKMI